ncbi:hypothetical protein FRB99_006146 [Tulasnella sp. 403]|nr:hypothetical protein FRB99_006146 [Tulasnella sp. 403]
MSSGSDTPRASLASISSQETIKAAKYTSTKAAFKELFGGAGNNRSLPRLSKADQVFVSGRGGARKLPISPSNPGPSNNERLEELLRSSLHPDRQSGNATSDVSSLAPSSVVSSQSAQSRTTVKSTLHQIFGGGGNDSGQWRSDFHPSYGRGGFHRPGEQASLHSSAYPDIEILSEAHSTNSSLSVARNAHGLFFFGHSSEDGPSYIVVGPGEGIIHPTPPQRGPHVHHPPHPSLNKSNMSKLSIKVAVKQVLGGGGNDDGEWKYVHIFYPYYGRGGEGTRGLRALDDIFNPRPLWYRRRSLSHASASTISFPSFSSGTSSLSRLDHTPPPSDSAIPSDSIVQTRPSHTCDPQQIPLDQCDDLTQIKARTMSEGASSVHPPELIRFRNQLQEERRRRLAAQAEHARDAAPSTSQRPLPASTPDSARQGYFDYDPSTIIKIPTTTSNAETTPSPHNVSRTRLVQHRNLPPPSPPPQEPLPAPPLPVHEHFAVDPTLIHGVQALQNVASSNALASADYALAFSLALVRARTETVRSMLMASPSEHTAELVQEREALQKERDDLVARVAALRREITRRENTIRGLTWLIGNLPEHRGMDVVVQDEEQIGRDVRALVEDAENELLQGESLTMLQEDRATGKNVLR